MAVQLFIGGACAGKRDAVAARWPNADWHALTLGQGLGDALAGRSSDTLVLYGVSGWLDAGLTASADDDALHQQWRADLDSLNAAFVSRTLVIIAHEMGRGIVPMARAERRLRDLNGWFNQDAATRAECVWYVRHGLAMPLKG